MKRIWILSERYFPEQTSTGYFLTKIAEGLAEEYNLKVITGPATKSLLPCEGLPKHEVRNKVEIWRCKGTIFNQNLLLGFFLNGVTRSVAIFWKTLFLCQREDTILVVTTSSLLPFVALIIKWLKRIQVVLLIHDVFPEALIAAGLCQPSSIIVRIGQVMNRILYSHSSKIVTLGRDMTRLTLAKLSDKDENKIVCIHNWADNQIVRPTKKANNPKLKELGVADKFVVLYAGNIGRCHGIEYVAEAAKILQKNENIHFIISGFGYKKKWLEQYVMSNNLENVNILNRCPSHELIIVLNACDLAIISYIPGMAGVSVPSRMYNQMAAGKPILAVADDWSELAQVVKEEEIGWVVEPGDVEGLVRTIELAAAAPDLCFQMGAKAAAVAQNKYDFNQANQGYKKLFSELLESQLG
ncbi:MAG: glycosyltransferase family 4 protein [Prochloraceae cyanobacterium]|nr:glycosyltransferase family 4 protein [Prochloraceae cyanobacterium]